MPWDSCSGLGPAAVTPDSVDLGWGLGIWSTNPSLGSAAGVSVREGPAGKLPRPHTLPHLSGEVEPEDGG